MLQLPTAITQESRRVKQILADQGLTVGGLATRFLVSHSHISNLLSGRDTSRWLQCEIARLVGQEPETLWGAMHFRLWAGAPARRQARERYALMRRSKR